MSYEDDIRREEARKRLEARRSRSEASHRAGSDRTRDRSSRNTSSSRTRERASQRDYTSQRDRSERSRSRTSQRGSSNQSRERRQPASSPVSNVLSAIGSGVVRVGSAIWNAYLNLVERFQWKTIIATVIVLLLLIFLLVSGIRGCLAGGSESSAPAQQASQSAAATSSSQASSSASASSATSESGASHASTVSATSPVAAIAQTRPEIDETEIDETALDNILGTEFSQMLLEQAKSNNDAHWIAAHPDEYLEDGTIVRYKMLRLAAKEPQAIPFVRDWPEKYCADEPDYNEDHSDDSSNGVPRLYQWDKRWGYTEYSSTTFALTGCAPTSLAMVYQARTGDSSKSPYDMGVYANENGYATTYDGTDGSIFTYGAAGLGLTSSELAVDAYDLSLALANGQIVVVNVGPGDFTDSGHYFVATGLDGNGDVIINDPFSAERSAQTWSIDTIISQTKALYAFA